MKKLMIILKLIKKIRDYFRLLAFKITYSVSSKKIYIDKNVVFPGYQHRKSITVGDSVKILRNTIIKGPNIIIGDRSVIHEYCLINTRGGAFKIGSDSSINAFSKLSCKGTVTIGNGVRIGSHFSLVASSHVFKDSNQPIFKQGIESKGIIIEDNVWIGTKVVILDGVNIGKNSIIAAGAVVNNNVPENSIVAGVPAKVIKKLY